MTSSASPTTPAIVPGPSDSGSTPVPVTTIRARDRWAPLALGELWRYREVMYFLTWRDVKVRYKQTALGVAWAVIQPLLTMVAFSAFFGRLAGIASDGVPYPVFSFAALVPWMFFANGLRQSAESVVTNQNLVRRVYFPRLALPAAAVLAGLVDLAVAFVVLLGMMAYYGIAPTIHLIWMPALLVLALVTALGVGLWLAALNVRYRDVAYMMPFVIQLWLVATPVAYPSSLLAPEWRALYALNPMVGVIEGVRWSLLGTATAPGSMISASTAGACVLLVGGAYYFRAMEDGFADRV